MDQEQYLDFEKPIAELESKIDGLRHLSSADGVSIAEEISRLQEKLGMSEKSVAKSFAPELNADAV